MSTKGITLEPGIAVVLSLDGTLVYVESVQPAYAAIIALPEQPPERTDDRVFTPGRVGAKKISPFATASAVVALDALSSRNQRFIAGYVELRTTHGPNYIDRIPEEEAAMSVTKVDPKAARAAAKIDKAEKKAKKERKREPKCAKCDQVAAHINHPNDHEFAPPTAAVKTPKEKASRAPRAAKPMSAHLVGSYRWVGTIDGLNVLAAGNPKYNPKNSGAAIVEVIRAKLDIGATPDEVLIILSAHDRWKTVPLERVQFAFGQLLTAKLIEAVA